ncbi:hypothetical protein CU098_012950, partial [Rhizopus stolonifer]
MSNIFECANAFISLEDPMEIDDPMDVDGPSEMKQSIEVDPPAFVISVMGIEYKVIDRSFGYGLVVLVAGDQLNKAHHFVAVYD